MRLIALLCCRRSRSQPPAPPPRSSATVLAAQVMLDRAGFSPGEIDGRAGSNLQRALSRVSAVATACRPTGQLDDATWQRLTRAGGDVPPLVDYAITDARRRGAVHARHPGEPPGAGNADGARTTASPLEAHRRDVPRQPALLRQLNPGATFRPRRREIRCRTSPTNARPAGHRAWPRGERGTARRDPAGTTGLTRPDVTDLRHQGDERADGRGRERAR